MAEYILKDSRGKEQTFADDKIFVQGTDGELVQFTMGTGEAVLENLEVKENGTYTPGEGVDGFGSVVVDVDSTKITILPEQTLTGFAPSSTYGGLYVKELVSGTDGVVFDISIGKKYLITWDGIEYTVTAQDASSVMAGAIFMGNGSLFGLSGNNEPFVIGYSNNALLFMSLTETVESHSVGIWQKVTQEIILQDKTITENGTYSADEGFDGLGSVTVDVADSGGGSLEEPLMATGSFNPSSSTAAITIEHNLGVIPDYVSIQANHVGSGSVGYLIGFREGLSAENCQQMCKYMTDKVIVINFAYPIESKVNASYGYFNSANENTVKVCGIVCTLDTSKVYTWIACRFTQ